MIGLLQYQYPSLRGYYGCGRGLKPSGQIPYRPNNLLSLVETNAPIVIRKQKQSELVSNVYFHPNPNYITLRHQFFIVGLIKVPDDVISYLHQEHKAILREITGLNVP